MKTTDDLRPYGPGKFNLVIDAYVYDLLLDGCDDDCGDVSEHGVWYGRLNGPVKLDGPFADLTPGERSLLTTMAGCIVSEDSQGFVTVEYFTSKRALAAAWKDCENEINGDVVDDDDRSYGPQAGSLR